MNEQPVVITRHLSKHYGDFVALDQLSITVDRGHILGFIGPNGAGKTTMIKILVGLTRPTSGSASIAGADCATESRRIHSLVGYMPDIFASYDNMRVREYLDFFGAAFRIPPKARLQRIDEVLETTGSAHMQDLQLESLSHGMKQRIGIARTLMHDPQVLILDEPANGLDPQARIEMRQLLLQLARMGKTLILTSHILPELARICDTVAIVTHGRLRAFGTLNEIMQRVSQRRMVEVQLTNPQQVETMVRLLRGRLEEGAEINPSPAEAEVRFASNADDDELAAILRIAVQEGIGVSQFHEVSLDLEDAFLSVAGQNHANHQVEDQAWPDTKNTKFGTEKE